MDGWMDDISNHSAHTLYRTGAVRSSKVTAGKSSVRFSPRSKTQSEEASRVQLRGWKSLPPEHPVSSHPPTRTPPLHFYPDCSPSRPFPMSVHSTYFHPSTTLSPRPHFYAKLPDSSRVQFSPLLSSPHHSTPNRIRYPAPFLLCSLARGSSWGGGEG